MVNYPNRKRIQTANNSTQTTNQRGMGLEKDINDSNLYYREIDRAVIYKKPTPVQVVRVDYPKRSSAKIIEAFYKTPSTTDYNGIYKGRYIDFEAKETKSKSSFSFKNIHSHQITHLTKVCNHGGIAFMIIKFTALNETYLVDGTWISQAFLDSDAKSISYTDIKTVGYLIQESYTPRLKYLDVVDEVYFKED